LKVVTFAGTNMNLFKRLWKMPILLEVVCKYEAHRYGLERCESY